MKTSAPEPAEGLGRPAAPAPATAGRLSGFSSLRLELTILSIILVLVMSGTMGLTVAWIYGQALMESRLESATATARGAALALSLHEDWGSFPWPALERAAEQAGLKLVLAVDGQGRTVRREARAVTARDETALRAAAFGGQVETAFDGRRFSVAVPVLRRNLPAGVICFSGPPDRLTAVDETVRSWMLLALMVNILLMALFIIFFLNRRLVGPVKELARDLRDLGEDRFEPRARTRSSREIDELFQAFDRAAGELLISRRRLVEQLRAISEARASLVASEKMAAVGRLASGLAHELGNPIGALTGFIHLLRQDDLSPEDKKLILDHSAHELARMDGSLKELLHFSRPARWIPEPVNAAAVAGVALDLARPQKWAAGVSFSLEAEDERPMVLAERNSLLQVYLNLLANAGQALAGTAEPRVAVAVTADQDGWRRIRVTDNGPGVAPEDVPDLFEPYFTRKSPGQGTGLGLAISLSIIDGFGGRLEYAPAPDGGAEFTIILPAPRDEELP